MLGPDPRASSAPSRRSRSIKVLTGAGAPLYDRLLQYDGARHDASTRSRSRACPTCPVCGDAPDDHGAGRRCDARERRRACERLLAQAELASLGSACVAFSGGVDSSLVLAAAARALGPGPRGRLHGRRRATYLRRGARGGPRPGREPRRASTSSSRRTSSTTPRFVGQPARALLLLQGASCSTSWRAVAARARLRGARRRRQPRRPRRPPSGHARRRRARRAAAAAGGRHRQGRGPARWRASSAWPPGTRRSRPAWPRASPTASRSRRRSSRPSRAAEQVLRELGFRQCRVRHHGDVARVEVERGELGRALARRARRSRAGCAPLGFTYVTLDLEGFRSGSMNEASMHA